MWYFKGYLHLSSLIKFVLWATAIASSSGMSEIRQSTIKDFMFVKETQPNNERYKSSVQLGSKSQVEGREKCTPLEGVPLFQRTLSDFKASSLSNQVGM